MAMSITRYVNIISSVSGSSIVSERDLIGRFITSSPLLPPNTIIRFTKASEVSSYFGSYSEEAQRASFYFSYVSKLQTTPKAIEFASWAITARPCYIFPIQNNNSVLGSWTAITNGSFVLTMGGYTSTLTGLDFSSAANLAAVATTIQTAIRAVSAGGAVWTGATVVYSSSYGGFILTGGANDVVTNPVVVSASGTGTNITSKGLLGWAPEQQIVDGALIAGAIWASGSSAVSVSDFLESSTSASNNFGSFAFLNNLNITQSQIVEAATWNVSKNVMFMYCQGVTASNAVAIQTATSSIGGIGLTLTGLTYTQVGNLTTGNATITGLQETGTLVLGQPVSGTGIPSGSIIVAIPSSTSITISQNATATGSRNVVFTLVQFPEQIPMMIAAATDYNSTKSAVFNYEFNQFAGVTPSVSDDSTADAYDALSINYYGVTQTAGKQIAFYQRGFLQGLNTDILDMGEYMNEAWLKDACEAALMNMLLSQAQVPANTAGKNLIRSVLQDDINQALTVGVISVGKPLNQTQKNSITSLTGNENAWITVENNGYWIDVNIEGTGNEYIATYLLVYSKNDSIRKIEGRHALI